MRIEGEISRASYTAVVVEEWASLLPAISMHGLVRNAHVVVSAIRIVVNTIGVVVLGCRVAGVGAIVIDAIKTIILTHPVGFVGSSIATWRSRTSTNAVILRMDELVVCCRNQGLARPPPRSLLLPVVP